MALNNVVFPEPLGPTIVTISPLFKERRILLKTVLLPYWTLRFFMFIRVMLCPDCYMIYKDPLFLQKLPRS